MRSLFLRLLASLFLVLPAAQANEAVIRKSIAERVPDFPKIDEVRPTPIPGLFEVRVGLEIFYADAKGEYILQSGQLVELKTRRNLTEARVDQLSQVAFSSLPLRDALVWKRGNGERKLAVFADPNCGYCKRLERDLAALPDVTIYNFLYPVLGPDSAVKSRAIWCSKDASATWRSWMLDGVAPPRAMGECSTAAVDRNSAFGRKYRINGTPAIVFEDGVRVPGAMSAADIEKRLAEAQAKKPKG
jgi:thiol:disulfide interchange protein DsbC